jgi:3-hydroxyisobutyrate dehydrogenase-like beta-hydroxyacid dehydrogenase
MSRTAALASRSAGAPPRTGDGDPAARPRVGVFGLGELGLPVAAAIARAGLHVLAWDTDPARCVPASEHGLAVAEPAALLSHAQVVVTVLPDDPSLESLVASPGGLLAAMAPGTVHLCLGTISVALAGALATRHAEAGQHFVASPVFGRPQEAWAADLTAVPGAGSGCDEIARARALAVLACVAPRIHPVDSPQAACAVKLAGNLMIASAIATMNESFGLARAHGVPPALVHEVVTGRLFRGPVHEGVGRMLAAAMAGAPPAAPAFTMQLGLKDLSLVSRAAAAARLPMPVADAVTARFARAVELGHAGRDWAELPACL